MSFRRWTDTDDDRLIALARQTSPQLSWAAIGERFGVSYQAAFNRYKKVAARRGLPSKQGLSARWTDAEDTDLVSRCDAGEAFESVGRDLGRSGAACKQRYNTLKRPITITAAVRTDPAREAALAEAERLRKQPPMHHSITAWLCGDPLPGRSALDEIRKSDPVRGKHNRFAPAVTLPTGPLR